ncbi:DUF4388 domain-containing protein [Myxococcota bacterium]
MASQTTSAAGIEGAHRGHTSGSTALHGRIEAIGIHDLLRVSVMKRSTGRLLVFSDQEDAEIYYEDGRLVAAFSGSLSGQACLEQVLRMQEGEFEFAWGLAPAPDRKSSGLHEAMLAEVKKYYVNRVGTSDHTHSQADRRSGMHSRVAVSGRDNGRVAGAKKPTIQSVQPEQPSTAPARERPAQAAGAEALSGEVGSGTLDGAGRVLARSGSLSQQDAGLAALVCKLSASLGTALGTRELHRFEITAPGDKMLACTMAAGGLRIAKVSADRDPESVWRGLDR